MIKVVATFLALAPWVCYAGAAVEGGRWGPALGAIAGTCLVFYFIWCRLEEVD